MNGSRPTVVAEWPGASDSGVQPRDLGIDRAPIRGKDLPFVMREPAAGRVDYATP